MFGNWIKGVLAAFKQKNPTIWVIIAALLTAAQVVIDKLLEAGTIPEGTEWVEWVIWIIGLLLGSGGLASYEYRNQLKSSKVKPEKMLALNSEQKIHELEARNKVLEEIVAKA